MIFVNDIADASDFPWLTPAPIGTVETGWTAIVSDLLLSFGHALSAHPGVTIDILDLSESDGALRCDLVVDGTDDPAVMMAIEAVVAEARRRSAATCARCGQPGRLRYARPAWPSTLCDLHASRTISLLITTRIGPCRSATDAGRGRDGVVEALKLLA